MSGQGAESEKKQEKCNGGGKKNFVEREHIIHSTSTYIYTRIYLDGAEGLECGCEWVGFRSGIRAYTCTDAKQRVMYCYTHIQFGKWPPKE